MPPPQDEVNQTLAALGPESLGVGATESMMNKARARCGGCFLGMCREGKLDMDFAAFLGDSTEGH